MSSFSFQFILGPRARSLFGRDLRRFRQAGRTRMARAVEVLTEGVKDELRKGPKDVPSKGARLETIRLPRNTSRHLRIRTGRLIGSIHGSVKSQAEPRGWALEGRVGPQRVKYAAIHEFGGTTGRGGGTKIKARPYLKPAFIAKRRRIVKILEGAVNPLVR